MRPGPGPGTREGMTAASGTARTGRHRTWDGPEQPNTPARPPAPVPRRHIIGLPAGHLKDASGAATAAGLRPVLDPPGRSPRTWQLSGKQEAPVTHARRPVRTPRIPPLTRPRSFRDDRPLQNAFRRIAMQAATPAIRHSLNYQCGLEG